MSFFRHVIAAALLLPSAGLAQTDSLPETVELTSEEVYTIPEGADLHLYRARGPGIALWVRRGDGIDVYLSSAGTLPFKGYYVHGLGETGSRFFAQPQGDLMVATVGDSIKGKFIYWAPEMGEGNKDFSDNLAWSADGSTAGLVTYEDGQEYAYRNDERYGPYAKVFTHYVTPANDLLYLAITTEDQIRVFRNGEAISGDIADATQTLLREAKNGNGYLYAVIRKPGYWLLHNGELHEGPDHVVGVSISPDGASRSRSRIVDGKTEAVINDRPSGHLYTGATSPWFSKDGSRYALFGEVADEAGTKANYFEVDGERIGPFDGEPGSNFDFAGPGGPLVYGYQDGGQQHFFFGDTPLGSYEPGAAFQPKASPDGAHYVFPTLDAEGRPVLRTRDGEIALDTTDPVLNLSVDNAGDVHFYIKREDGYQRMRNDAPVADIDGIMEIVIEDRSPRDGEIASAILTAEGVDIYRGEEKLLTAEAAHMLRYAEIGERERLIGRVVLDGAEYLMLDGELAGPFGEVLLGRKVFDSAPADGLIFHSRTGEVISRHEWPL